MGSHFLLQGIFPTQGSSLDCHKTPHQILLGLRHIVFQDRSPLCPPLLGNAVKLSFPQFSSVTQSCPTLCDPRDCSTPGPAPSITNSRSLLRLVSIESVMPSYHLILCHSLLLPPSIFPSIRVFSNESVLRIRWPKYWSFSFIISSYNEYLGLIPDWISLQSKRLSRVFSNTMLQKHQFFGAQLSL